MAMDVDALADRSRRATSSSSATAPTRSGGDRARRRAAGRQQRDRRRTPTRWPSPRSAGRPSSSPRWTPTSPAAWSAVGAVPVVVGSRAADRRPDDLLADVADAGQGRRLPRRGRRRRAGVPIALVTRGELVRPRPRRVLLVDHAEQAQSVLGIEQAEIVEILDHHHIGSIETRVPVRATFDPVGSTATLVVERFRRGLRAPRRDGGMLLAAILSDTVILNSPTTTDRDLASSSYLERVLQLDAREFGREMFEYTRDVSDRRARRSSRATPRSTRSAAGTRVDRAGRDRGQDTERPRRAARGAGGRAPQRGPRARRAHGHRHREPRDAAARGRRRPRRSRGSSGSLPTAGPSTCPAS